MKDPKKLKIHETRGWFSREHEHGLGAEFLQEGLERLAQEAGAKLYIIGNGDSHHGQGHTIMWYHVQKSRLSATLMTNYSIWKGLPSEIKIYGSMEARRYFSQLFHLKKNIPKA
ncbi:MAG: hypothetical protein AABW82_03685 [Nanoarchaeota archaeon]